MPDTQKRAAEQQDAVSRLELQAEQAIASIPATYASRSSLIADIQGAVASARAAARSGNAIDLSALKQLIDKAQEVGKETTQRQNTHQYIEGSIVLSEEAQRRIEISSQRITEQNRREFVEAMVDPEKEMDATTRTRIRDSVDAGLQTPHGKEILEIRNSFDDETRKTTSILQESGRAEIVQMRAETQDPKRRRVLDRAIHSDAIRSPEELENIQKLKAGELSTEGYHQTVIEAEAEKARLAQPFKQAIINGLPADRRAVLAQVGTPDASGIDLQAVMHANGDIPKEQRAADWRMLGQYENQGKHFGDLPPDVQRRLAIMESAKHVIIYGGMEQYNELALFVAKSKGRESELSQDDQTLIAKYNIINDPNASKEARSAAIIDVYSKKNPELYATIQKSPKMQEYTINAALKAIDENQGKFGIENNPHLQEITQAVSKDVSASFSAGMDAMLAGDAKATEQAAKDAAVGVAETAKSFGLSDNAAQTLQDASHTVLSGMGSAAVNVVQTYNSFFSSDPTFNAEIQQQLAQMEPELAALRDAQGNALVIKDAEGKIDMAKVAEALKEKGIALKEVDKDASGDITGKELLTALGTQRQSQDLLAKN